MADIKQESEPTDGLEGRYSAPPPEPTSKRPFDDISATSETSEAKRAKTETETEEASLEDGLALLVQNALSNVEDLIDQFSSNSDNVNPDVETPSDPMEVDAIPPLPDSPVAQPAFSLEPQKFIRNVNIHALGNLVSSNMSPGKECAQARRC